MKKRWMIFVLACCLTAGITGSVVYAYLIDQKETVNQIRILENTTHIEEEFEPPDEVKPGQVIKKKPCIANDSGFPVFIRARVIFSNDRGEAQCQPLEIADSWKKGEDGYYYYQKKVLSGQRTDVIFDKIVIKNTVKKDELVSFEYSGLRRIRPGRGIFFPGKKPLPDCKEGQMKKKIIVCLAALTCLGCRRGNGPGLYQ